MTRQDKDVRSTAFGALRRTMRLTLVSMILEQALRAFWPAASLAFVGFAVWRWGAMAALPPLAVQVATGVGLAALALLVWRGLRVMSWPDERAVVNRLDETVSGEPVATLRDRLALGHGQADAEELWALHMQEMAERSRNVRAVGPDMRLARLDPFGLRLIALLAFASALLFAGSNEPRWVSAEAAVEPVVAKPIFEGWAEPPIYTGRPTVYLGDDDSGTELRLPIGSVLTLRVYGFADDIEMHDGVSGTASEEAPDAAADTWQRQLVVERSGEVRVLSGEEPVWSRTFAVIPDEPPFVEVRGNLEATLNGGMTLKYRAGDDYGVTTGVARIVLDPSRVERRPGLGVEPEAREALTLELPLPYYGGKGEFDEELIENLADHPYAGLPVIITLEVGDAAGNTGRSEPITTTMPGRRFFDKLAASLSELKQDLDWSRENAPRTSRILRALTHHPSELFDDSSVYLLTRTALRRLERSRASEAGLTPEARDEITSILWWTALLIEDGNLASARERLERARERLETAMQQGATEEEIEELMRELRDALNEYMRELAQNALRNADREFADRPPGEMMSTDDIHDMLDRIQELMEQGRMAEAQELLRQLQGLMENMQAALEGGNMRPGSGGDPTLDGLRDTLQQQQGLADDTFRELQGNPGGPGGVGPQGLQPLPEGMSPGQDPDQLFGGTDPDGQPGTGNEMSDQDLAARQEALRQMLEQQREQLPLNDDIAGGEQLDEAEDAMASARENLERGDNNSAMNDQARAIEALRQGLRDIGEARNNRAQGATAGNNGDRPDNGDFRALDPLGRQTGDNGSVASDGRALPGGEFYDRSREVIDEIRRRSNDRTRPESELDYLRRLLDRF